MDTESITAIAIVLIIVAYVALMFLSFWISKQFSAALFIIAFLGGAVYIAFTSRRDDLVVNILIWGLVFVVVWLRLNKASADTARARTQLLDRLNQKNFTVCASCGSQLSYHRKPKNLGQLMLGGLTCLTCGAEKNIPLDALFSK
jgi:hypothetical protein